MASAILAADAAGWIGTLPNPNSLPAATATKVPRSTAWRRASVINGDGDGPPRLRLITAAPCRTAWRTALATATVAGAAAFVGGSEDEVPRTGDELARHDPDVDRRAGQADPGVREVAEGARDMRAVAVDVQRMLVFAEEVERGHEAVGPASGVSAE